MFEDINELLKQIQVGEDAAVELKELKFGKRGIQGPSARDLADELAAMANTNRGVFLLGVSDKTKAVVGIPRDRLDAVETWVRDVCNDQIEPALLCGIRKVRVPADNGEERVIIRVDVPKSMFVHRGPGGHFHRLGSSKRQMSQETLARLFQQRSQTRLIRFDEQAVAHAQSDCLDKALWGKFKAPDLADTDAGFLLKLRLLTKDEDGWACPTVSGLLMACPAPEAFLSNAFIQAVAYRGRERDGSRQLDARDITGPLDAQIADACKFVERNMKIGAVKRPARLDIPQYDLHAVFEAVVNAVAHRDYSIYGAKVRLYMFADRLELYSPGALANTLTLDAMTLLQYSRNELLTSLLSQCPIPQGDYTATRERMMDKRGQGVRIILENSRDLSGRLPAYRLINDAELLLTLYAAEPPE